MCGGRLVRHAESVTKDSSDETSFVSIEHDVLLRGVCVNCYGWFFGGVATKSTPLAEQGFALRPGFRGKLATASLSRYLYPPKPPTLVYALVWGGRKSIDRSGAM